MNYLAHALSVQFLGDLGILGSAVPDLRYHRFNHLHRPANSAAFLAFVQEQYPGYDAFARGALNHQVLDALTSQRGSYFAKAKEDIAIVLKQNSIPPVYAEIVLDVGIDSLVLGDVEEVIPLTKSAWQAADIGEMAGIMAQFFQADAKAVHSTLSTYREILPLMFEAYRTAEGCAEAVAMRLNRLRQQRDRERAELNPGMFLPAFEYARETLRESYHPELMSLIEQARSSG